MKPVNNHSLVTLVDLNVERFERPVGIKRYLLKRVIGARTLYQIIEKKFHRVEAYCKRLESFVEEDGRGRR